MSTIALPDGTGVMLPDVFDDGDRHQCDWGLQWCPEPAYGWIDAWLPSQGDRERPGRMHLCRRHYAFQLEENIHAILHDPEYQAAQDDEQRRVVAFRYIIAFGRE